MLSCSFKNYNNCDKISYNFNLSKAPFAGIKPMPNDSFEKSQTPKTPDVCTIDSIQNGDYEGYVTLNGTQYIPSLRAHYDICDEGNPPSYESGAPFDGTFTVGFVENHKKAEPDAETYIKQSGKGTETEIVAKIAEDLGESFYKVKVDNFPHDIIISLDDVADYKAGDTIEASGLLDCEFND